METKKVICLETGVGTLHASIGQCVRMFTDLASSKNFTLHLHYFVYTCTKIIFFTFIIHVRVHPRVLHPTVDTVYYYYGVLATH